MEEAPEEYRGGTFTDVLVRSKGINDLVFKLLSVDPRNYRDAPTEAVRRALELVEGREIPRSEKLDASRVKSCRIGTTIATNALLEGKGEKFALLTTKGFKDVCTIGDQTRPRLFDLNIKKAHALHALSVEIDERVTVEDYDLNPFPQDKNRALTDPALVRTASGEIAYVADFQAGFHILPKRVEFICSDGSLRNAGKFGGNDALLSGPAGGVVGIAKSCYDMEDQTPIIGFDMGGTSTDVSRYDGKFDYLAESTIAGRNVSTAMLNIATVAAGGVTDANLFLGRLVVTEFPSIFGENADQSLDIEATKRKFHDLAADVAAQTGQELNPEQIALGFLDVANETMSRPIRNATEARGFSPDKHNLVSFGGAGGQHACAIADKLGIRRVIIHKYSSILSAYGLSQAVLQAQSFEPYSGSFSLTALPELRAKFEGLRAKVEEELISQGAAPDNIVYEESLSLRYKGTDTNLSISKPDDEDYGAAFDAMHLREFAFKLDREAVVDSVHVRGVATSSHISDSAGLIATLDETRRSSRELPPTRTQPVYIQGEWKESGVFKIVELEQGDSIRGPALLIDDTQTILVEPNYAAYILLNHVVLEKTRAEFTPSVVADDKVEPIQLSVFSHRFMSIAEQMGNTLQRTSISTSIKERLDFSCAIFSPNGNLVANAPHIPLHLGSMQYAIQCQHALWKGKLQPGDSLLTNHPELGGTHLPDLTVVTPVFIDNAIAFYVASRGHHTDNKSAEISQMLKKNSLSVVGGKGITAMMPTSKELWEEGVLVRSMKIVSGGRFEEQEVRDAFLRAGEYPGCSPSRRLNDNISDVKAQISANQRGLLLLQKLAAQFSLPVIHKYMYAIQDNAQVAVRKFLQQTRRDRPEPLTATDHFDDGTKIQVKITISEDGSAIYDFEGTGPQMWGNYNCPISITQSAAIYTVRCLIDTDIPLNEGCLTPITIRVPKGSVLNPGPNVAICGSTLASQRVIDVILRAYAKCAAFAGCANSFGWGLGGKDPVTGNIEPGFNYGETVGGGSGAGPGWHGEHAVQVHSTNTKITDAEVVEKRTPVLVTKHAIAHGTGGRGEFVGGNGGIREVEARIPLRFSILSDRRVYAPYGMNGGESGEVGKNYAFRWNQDHTELEKISLGGKAELLLQPGERLQVNSPAGGGWGIPPYTESAGCVGVP
ncbi:hypothetical protein SNOG_04179 [Parastagonospora nodorum SN15]|uniref:Hydantoinase B/oxoprolinase domain-containing protein n=1 Tax=Phaeosphaeria nodorum (strain SN15 / ATCC MYA-4574 / FGSC 10173) TaxID=321614 RepID=Q0UVN5_PHANO|nr:hypothetical protein SNOG_04179 [Parastagonospora nodorum SN15]EAT87939.2 hypothetical protein SNOG_04179 [Parastagonospora nodorum SN15]